MMKLQTLEDVFAEQVSDLYSAERQLTEALPKMVTASSNDKLREAFQTHLEETRTHLRRLDDVAETTPIEREDEECQAMKGLIAEGEEIIGADGSAYAKDAALIAAAQRVEHYEIAAYGSARDMAKELGFIDASKKLDETLSEEAEADKLLTKIATGGVFSKGINPQA
jgi:ferritin-like metal-binding protein YciE